MAQVWFSRTFVQAAVWTFLVWLNAASGFSCVDGMVGQCTCTFKKTVETNVDYVIHCPSKQPGLIQQFSLKIGPSFIDMSCGENATMDDILPLLEGLNIGEKHVIKMKQCPVPSVSFSELFRKMGAANVKFLSFASASWGNETLRPFHFDGLGELLHLELTRSRIEVLATDMFRGTPKLEQLNLNGNWGMQLESQVFQSLPALKILTIGSCGIKAFNENTFSGLRNLTELSLHRNLLNSLEASLFSDLTNVSTLSIAQNGLRDLPPGIFDGLHSLENITLSGNYFHSLPENLFANNMKLKKVDWFLNGHKRCIATNCDRRIHVKLPFDLFHNSTVEAINMIYVAVEEIPDGWLRGCKHLKNITFRQGNIKDLPSSLFNESFNLERIDFENNGLSSIPNDLFSDTRNLKSIRLGKNNLKQINNQHFSHVRNLRILDLSKNVINYVHSVAFSNLQKLQELDLSFNQINGVQLFPQLQHVPQLQILNLANNRIFEFHNARFFSSRHLRLVNLSGNALEGDFSLDYADIQFLSKYRPVYLDVSNNKLTRFSLGPSSEKNKNVSTIINVHGNPILCDCFSSILKQQFEKDNATYSWFALEKTNIICPDRDDSPQELVGQNLLDVDYNKLNCFIPESVNCPKKCICHWNRFYNNLVINCTGAQIDVFPSIVPLVRSKPNITLHLENNKISDLARVLKGFKTESPRLWNTTTQLYLSNNHLKNLDKEFLPPNLEEISFDNNKMESINKETIKYLYNVTEKIKLGGNPYTCGCNSTNIYHFINDRKSVVVDLSYTFLNCSGKNKTLLSEMEPKDFCDNSIPKEVIVGIASSVIVMFLVCGFLVFVAFNKESLKIWLYSKSWSRWIFPEDLIDKDKEYDAFLSYAHQDAKFVENTLLDGLENPEDDSYKYKCLIHTRDWNVGQMIPEQIINSVENSRRTIIVLTSDYIQSMWSKMEFSKAHDMGLQDRAPRVIIIVHGELPPIKDMNEDLQSYIKMNTYLESSDPWFWQKLRYALPHRGAKYKKQQRKRRRTESIELMGDSGHQANTKCDIV